MSAQNQLNLQYRYFLVNKRAFCVWDPDLQKRSLKFLDQLDPSYFDYIVKAHIPNIGEGQEARSRDSQHAAILLRSTYSQALETLFALLGCAVQGPHCVPAWMNLYRNNDLIDIVCKIHEHEPIESVLNFQILTWDRISEAIFENLVLEDKPKETAIKTGFSQLWSRFASDFLSIDFRDEYNGIKHGFRVQPGGFHLAMGAQSGSNPSVPADKMVLMGKSEFGSSYVRCEEIGETEQHIKYRSHYRNWDPNDMAWGIRLASLSISNVQSALKIQNGVNAEKIQFAWPEDVTNFHEPWEGRSEIGVTSMNGFDT